MSKHMQTKWTFKMHLADSRISKSSVTTETETFDKEGGWGAVYDRDKEVAVAWSYASERDAWVRLMDLATEIRNKWHFAREELYKWTPPQRPPA